MIKKYNDFEIFIYSSGNHLLLDINPRQLRGSKSAPLIFSPDFQPFSLTEVRKEDVAQIGYALYDQLFIQELANKFKECQLQIQPKSKGLRLFINSNLNTINRTAWELLCQHEATRKFLALDAHTPLIRSIASPEIIYPAKLRFPLRILVFLASPILVTKIDPAVEKAALQKVWEGYPTHQLQVDFVGFDQRAEANFDTLQELLTGQAKPYDIVHIIAHGIVENGKEAKILLVEPDKQQKQAVSATSLANLFSASAVKLVILQACQSGASSPSLDYLAGVAEQLVGAGVPAVLAMQDKIEQDVATLFFTQLYNFWLNKGYLFEEALTQARHQVYQKFPERKAAWAIPVFYSYPLVELKLMPSTKLKVKPAPPTTVSSEWQLEAALQRQAHLHRAVELVVLLRQSNNTSLADLIGQKPQEFQVKAEDVSFQAPRLELNFQLEKESGKLLSKTLYIIIESQGFEPEKKETIIQVRLLEGSVMRSFQLIPKQVGRAIVLVRVVEKAATQEVSLAEVRLSTEIYNQGEIETGYNLASSPKQNKIWQTLKRPLNLILTALAILIISLGVSLLYFFRATPSAMTIARIYYTDNKATLVRQTDNSQYAISTGMPLYQNDVVNAPNGTVAILYADKTLQLVSNRQIKIEAGGADGVKTTLPDSLVFALVQGNDPPNTLEEVRGSSLVNQIPVVTVPRFTKITSTKPTFSWSGVLGALKYQLILSDKGGVVWQSNATTNTFLTYPVGQAELKRNNTYFTKVIAELPGGSVVSEDAISFDIVNLEEAQTLATLIQPFAKDTCQFETLICRYLQANIYAEKGYLADAIETMQELVRLKSTDPNYQRLLGDYLLQIGLLEAAQQSYSQILVLTAQVANPFEEAPARVGLGIIFYEQKDLGRSRTELQIALNLYTNLKDKAGQNNVRKLLEKI
jgi:CHAT domain